MCAVGGVLVCAQGDVTLVVLLLVLFLGDERVVLDAVLLFEFHLALLELEFELLGRVRLERQRAVGVGRADVLAVGFDGDVLHGATVLHDVHADRAVIVRGRGGEFGLVVFGLFLVLSLFLGDELAVLDHVLALDLGIVLGQLEFELLSRVRLERQRAVGVGRPDVLVVGFDGDVLHTGAAGRDGQLDRPVVVRRVHARCFLVDTGCGRGARPGGDHEHRHQQCQDFLGGVHRISTQELHLLEGGTQRTGISAFEAVISRIKPY